MPADRTRGCQDAPDQVPGRIKNLGQPQPPARPSLVAEMENDREKEKLLWKH